MDEGERRQLQHQQQPTAAAAAAAAMVVVMSVREVEEAMVTARARVVRLRVKR